MKLSLAQQAFTNDVVLLLAYIHRSGYSVSLGEAYRTPEQAEIYAKAGVGIKDSQHCKRLAIDLNLFSPSGVYLTETDDYEPFGIYWVKLNEENRWGGYFKKRDGNHFQRNNVLGNDSHDE